MKPSFGKIEPNDDNFRVKTKVYQSVTCTNEQWTGGSEVIELSTTFTFSAECYGGEILIFSNKESLMLAQ